MTVNRSPLQRWPAGPPAPADGFSQAWRTSRRRRRRTALLTSVPVVLVALAIPALVAPHLSSPRGLDSVTSRVLHDRDTAPPTPAGHSRAGGPANLSSGQAQAVVVGQGSAGAKRPGATGAVATTPGAPSPTPGAGSSNGTLVLSGRAASYGTFTLRTPCFLRLDQMATQGGRTYVGAYLRRADAPGDVGVVSFPQLDQPGLSKFQMQWGTLQTQLPAGRYTAYLVADSTASVTIPLQAAHTAATPSVVVNATKASSITARVQQASLGLGATNTSIREAPLFDAGTAGVVGAYFGSQSNMSGVQVAACRPRQGAGCASGDPQAHGNTAVAVGGYVGATVDVTAGHAAGTRDELATAAAPATTTGTLYLISLAVRIEPPPKRST